jgi:putative transposase
LTEYFDFYNEERPHQSLGNLTPGVVYRTAIGGGAMILDKYPRTMEESTVPLSSTVDSSIVPPGLIEVVKATAGQCV